jgi:hypothetical protein
MILTGSFWVILAPTNQTTTNAAVAFISSLITGWISYLGRESTNDTR